MEPGLCARCEHLQIVGTPRSVFYLCGMHKREPTRFAKYPVIPVERCPAFDPYP
jgi:hypothetical protein